MLNVDHFCEGNIKRVLRLRKSKIGSALQRSKRIKFPVADVYTFWVDVLEWVRFETLLFNFIM